MTLRRMWLATLAGAALLSGARGTTLSDFLPRSLVRSPSVPLTVITEFTVAGRSLPPVSPNHPVYYQLDNLGYSTAGDVVAGEHPPAFQVLANALTKALAVNGYRLADKNDRPRILLACRYGDFNEFRYSMNPLIQLNTQGSAATSAADQAGDPSNSDYDPVQRVNLIERAGIVGGQLWAAKFAAALNNEQMDLFRADPKNADLVNMIMFGEGGNLYYLIASAYDIASARQGRLKLLWRTKVATNSQGLELDETLPALVRIAAPYFGKEMTESARLRTRLPEGTVEIGTPVVKP